MTAWTLAATPGSLFEQIGSYAGYASVIGLGIMALLYFGQAREVKRLREWAGRAPERALELEQRPQPDPNRRVIAQPLAPSTTAAQSAAAATAALYASVGATAPGTATTPPGQLARPGAPTPPAAAPGSLAAGAVPVPVPPPGAASAPGPAPASAPSTSPATAAATAAAQTPATEGAKGTDSAEGQTPAPGVWPTVTATPAPPPPASPTPQAASAAAQFAASRPVQEPPLFGNGSLGQPTRESAAARPDPLPPAPRGPSSDESRLGFAIPRLGVIIGGAVALLAVGLVIFLVAGNDAEPPKPNDFGNTPASQEPEGGAASSSSSSSGSKSTAITTAERRGTKVAVLNGTTQTGLARNVADELEKKSYTIGGTDNNVDQSLAVTTVSYKPGEERVARDIARIIRVTRDLVQPVDANTAVASDADVVVTVGADKIG